MTFTACFNLLKLGVSSTLNTLKFIFFMLAFLLGYSLLRIMCFFRLHLSGTMDGGCMGDSLKCDICGEDRYPEYFPGWIIRKRSIHEDHRNS